MANNSEFRFDDDSYAKWQTFKESNPGLASSLVEKAASDGIDISDAEARYEYDRDSVGPVVDYDQFKKNTANNAASSPSLDRGTRGDAHIEQARNSIGGQDTSSASSGNSGTGSSGGVSQTGSSSEDIDVIDGSTDPTKSTPTAPNTHNAPSSDLMQTIHDELAAVVDPNDENAQAALAAMQENIDNGTPVIVNDAASASQNGPVPPMTERQQAQMLEQLDRLEEAAKASGDEEQLEAIQNAREQINNNASVDISVVSNNPEVEPPVIDMEASPDIENGDELDPNAVFESSNDVADTEVMQAILNKLAISNAYIDDILSGVTECTLALEDIYDPVKEKLKFTADDFDTEIRSRVRNNWGDLLETIMSDIKTAYNIMEQTEAANNEGADDTLGADALDGNPGGGGYSGSSSGDPGTPDVSDVPPSTITPGTEELNPSAVAGLLTFTGLIPLYDQIGGSSNIQGSLTSQYQVVEIINENGKYYYKIYDPELKRFFYAEISETSILTTDYSKLLISKEGESTMMLTEPKIGENVFSKMTEPNKAYFVLTEEPVTDENGIQYATVLDGSDAKVYYVPLDNSVEMIDLGSVVANVVNPETSTDSSNQTVSPNTVGGGSNL